METRHLMEERLEVLPRRLETFKISMFNTNLAVVEQINYSEQHQFGNVVAEQWNTQGNYAQVNQSN